VRNTFHTTRAPLRWPRRWPAVAVFLLLSAAVVPARGQLFGHKDEDVWAVRCLTLRGPNRFKQAEECADLLRKVRGLKAKLVRVIHTEQDSRVYYGRYRKVYNKRTGKDRYKPDPRKDLALIRQLSMDMRTPTGAVRPYWPFRYATVETLPIGKSRHPEWQLCNAPGYYSLQVAVFYDSGEMRRRRFAAEEYCKLLRDKGEEAYFDHGEINSSVCIGAFPKTAIETYQYRDPLTGVIRVKSRIVDKRMLELQKKYPHNLQNGRVMYQVSIDPKTGRKIRTPDSSFPVIIPHEKKAGATRGVEGG